MRFGVGLFADRAAKAAKSISVFTEALTLRITLSTSHCNIAVCCSSHKYIISVRSLFVNAKMCAKTLFLVTLLALYVNFVVERDLEARGLSFPL